jgi:hypothetical protein
VIVEGATVGESALAHAEALARWENEGGAIPDTARVRSQEPLVPPLLPGLDAPVTRSPEPPCLPGRPRHTE